MDDIDILTQLEERGLAVDEGGLIGGPFIPDGIVRIYDPETHDVLGYGHTLQEAFDNL